MRSRRRLCKHHRRNVDDLLVVRPGEVALVAGRIVDLVAVLDGSVLTGKPLMVERGGGTTVGSGVVNARPGLSYVHRTAERSARFVSGSRRQSCCRPITMRRAPRLLVTVAIP